TAEVHLGPRQDPRPSGHRGHLATAAADRPGGQERAGDGAAALHHLEPLTETTMKIILTQEVSGLGAAGDVVEVKDGYGRNCLLPRGYAIRWSRGAEKEVVSIRRARAAREIRDLDQANEIAQQLSTLNVRLSARAGSGGRLFGSVTPAEIVEAVKAAGGPSLDRRRVETNGTIKSTGSHKVRVRLHPEVTATFDLSVVPAR